MEARICAKCKELKGPSDFNVSNPWYCKACKATFAREWRQRRRVQYLIENPPPPPAVTRKCGSCHEEKQFSEYHRREEGWQFICKACNAIVGAMRRSMGGRQYERLRYKCSRMGCKPEWFNEQMELQGGLCAICKSPETHPIKRGSTTVRSLAIDHDHETGKLRGLLCFRCNTALHQLEKYLGWAKEAEAYLESRK